MDYYIKIHIFLRIIKLIFLHFFLFHTRITTHKYYSEQLRNGTTTSLLINLQRICFLIEDQI